MNRIKIIAIAMLMGVGFILPAQDLPSPMQPPRLVNDFANILTDAEKSALEAKLRNYYDTTSTQLYIITVGDLQGYDVADYTIKIGEKWGIGQQGKNNGALILVKPRVGNQRGESFIAIGYGLEDVIPDAITKR
ncbi:MAG: TPM domain-containing protein, partial [Tenuifilaceae bacterium]|nr:TPM domain-containing protein [Tenuifilaceae bacterium]